MPTRPTLPQFARIRIDTPVLHDSRDIATGILPLEPCSVQEPKVSGTGSLARIPETIVVRAQVLVHFQGCRRRPVGVASVGPGLCAPAREEEGGWFRNVLVGPHLAEDVHNFGFGLFVALTFSAPGEFIGNGYEHDVRVGEEFWH